MRCQCGNLYEQRKVKQSRSELVITLVCGKCKRTKVVAEREYPAVIIRFRLKPDTSTTYVVSPEIFNLGWLESVNAGKGNYDFVVPLGDASVVMNAFAKDDRIEDWGTLDRGAEPHA